MTKAERQGETSDAATQESIVLAALEALYPDRVPLEMRVLTKSAAFGTVSGVYDDYGILAEHGLRWNAEGFNVYITLNGTNLKVTNGCFPRRWRTTRDSDVPSYRYLFLDLDPVREPNTSSTNAEKLEAWKTLASIREYLAQREWPAPFVADSGNGFHLLYRVDLPVNPESIAIVRNCLMALDAKFSTPHAKVDTTTFNPARIVKLYGTFTRKGEHTPERPYRRSELKREDPGPKEIVPTQLLLDLAAEAPSKARVFAGQGEAPEGAAEEKLSWLVGWLDAHRVHHSRPHKRDDGSWILFVSCPWKARHTIDSGITETAVFAMPGGFGFDCRHDHCADKQWSDFRRAIEGKDAQFPLIGNA
jgi:hypothetical protein